MGIIDRFKKQINKPKLVFPQIITDSEFIRRMDTAFHNRNAYWLSVLYRKAACDEDIFQAQKIVNEGLTEERELNDSDLELINNIVKAYQEVEEKYIIFESVGNLMFISEVIEELRKEKGLSDIVKITCFLWLYQNIVEIILAHLSEIFYMIAKNRKQNTFLKLYNDSTEKEEHLMMGQLLNFSKQKENAFTSENKETFLHYNELRNRLAHANCFYDSVRKEIVLKNDCTLGIEDFKKEFKRVRDFLYEFINQLNGNHIFDMKTDLINMANRYFRMSRDPIAMKVFKNKKVIL